jgi:hypothetical protein
VVLDVYSFHFDFVDHYFSYFLDGFANVDDDLVLRKILLLLVKYCVVEYIMYEIINKFRSLEHLLATCFDTVVDAYKFVD